MKVLMLGGTGRLSADTTMLCAQKGFEVYLFNRGSNNTFSLNNIHYIIGDINNLKDTKHVLSNHFFDVVIDYLTYDLDTLKKRIETFNTKTKQYIFVSSATVFKPSDEAIFEGSPIGNDEWIYCKNKLICEKYLSEHKSEFTFAYTIVRPYVTYDKKRIPFPIISKKSCWNLMYRVDHNLPILLCGDGEQSVALTSTKDFAVGITGLIGNESAYYDDYNIVGDYNYTWNDVVIEIENYLNKKADVVYVPMGQIRKLVPSCSQEVLYDKGLTHVFDNRKIKNAVPEFKTTILLHDGMTETLDYLSTNKAFQTIDCEWNAMENIVAARMGYGNGKVNISDRWLYFRNESSLTRIVRKISKLIN